jgi:hemerythrin-like metal-binding protein
MMNRDSLDNPADRALIQDPYRIGEPTMDGEHLRLVNALQRLEESLRGPHGLETLAARLRQLEDMTLEHFRNEEELMARVGYPHLDLHRTEHQMLIEHSRGLLGQFSGPDSPPLPDLARRLADVFLHHTETVDRDYAAFLARNGFTGTAD